MDLEAMFKQQNKLDKLTNLSQQNIIKHEISYSRKKQISRLKHKQSNQQKKLILNKLKQ